ncbi:MAG: outer membrane beta-barrel protein [Alphaproteobacteria bacterium]|nr:outer membrane beta-barrel protein [Alphaproteobacteria bacterium]
MKSRLIAAALIAAAVTPAATPAAAEQGDWLVRLRGIVVAPTEKSGAVLPAFPTGKVSVDNAYAPELDFTYFLTNHIGAELILATTRHDINGAGALSGLGRIADARVLPPTLTVQYHFLPQERVRPYVGVGLNYTIFYDEGATAALTGALGPTTVGLRDSVGYAFQAGVDIDITKRFFFNADVKYIDINTRATLDSGGTINRVHVDLNPIVAGVGVGMRF